MATYQQGQVVVGSRVEAAPVVYGNTVTTDAGIVAGGGKPTVAALTPAGTAATITSQVGTDQAGSFVLTAGTFPTIGSIVSVTFATPLPAAPASVIVNAANTTSGTASAVVMAAGIQSTTGFTIYDSAALVLASTYLISYQVFRQN